MIKCPYCHKEAKKLFEFYQKSYRLERQHPKCLTCIDAGEFETGMWKEVK